MLRRHGIFWLLLATACARPQQAPPVAEAIMTKGGTLPGLAGPLTDLKLYLSNTDSAALESERYSKLYYTCNIKGKPAAVQCTLVAEGLGAWQMRLMSVANPDAHPFAALLTSCTQQIEHWAGARRIIPGGIHYAGSERWFIYDEHYASGGEDDYVFFTVDCATSGTPTTEAVEQHVRNIPFGTYDFSARPRWQGSPKNGHEGKPGYVAAPGKGTP